MRKSTASNYVDLGAVSEGRSTEHLIVRENEEEASLSELLEELSDVAKTK